METLSKALSQIRSFKKAGYNINTIYLNSHGTGGKAALIPGNNGSIEAEGAIFVPGIGYRFIDPIVDDEYISTEQLNWYSGLSKSDYKFYKKEGYYMLNVIEQLIDIATEIKDGGTLIFGGCNIGKGKVGEAFMLKLYEITGKRINIVANTAASISTDHYNKSIDEEARKKSDKVISKIKYPAKKVQFDLLLDKGLTSTQEQNNGFGWRKIGTKTNGVISTNKDLYLNTKGDAYSFKTFKKFTIPDYFHK